MGGQEGNRGYLLQAIVAGLNSLKDRSWKTVQIEPDGQHQKVDIKWIFDNGSDEVCQVKSTTGSFEKSAILQTLADLVADSPTAASYRLVLLGFFSSPVSKFLNEFKKDKMTTFGDKYVAVFKAREKIKIDRITPEADILDAAVNNEIHAFLSSHQLTVSHETVKQLGLSLSANFSRFACDGRQMARNDFEDQLFKLLQPENSVADNKKEGTIGVAFYKTGELALTDSLTLHIRLYDIQNQGSIKLQLDTTKTLTETIAQIELPPRSRPDRERFVIRPMVTTPQGMLDYGGLDDYFVRKYTVISRRVLDIDLAPDFFQVGNVGNLPLNYTTVPFSVAKVYVGRPEEIEKQQLIDQLVSELMELDDLFRLWRKLQAHRLLPLILYNDAGEPFNDLRIQLEFDAGATMLSAGNFPLPKCRRNIELFSEDKGLHQYFFQHKDSRVRQYPHSAWPKDYSFLASPIESDYQYKSKYLQDIIDVIFDYEIHDDVLDKQIIEFQLTALNPGERVAFPSFIFLNRLVPASISYTIKSTKEMVSGLLNIIA